MTRRDSTLLRYELLLILLPCLLLAQNKVYDFALKLYNDGEYYRAISEFERFLFFFPKDDRADNAGYLIGRSYYYGKRYQQAVDSLSALMPGIKKGEYVHKIKFLTGESYLAAGNFGLAYKSYDELSAQTGSPLMSERASYRKGWARLSGKRWKEASDELGIFLSAFPQSVLAESASGIRSVCDLPMGRRSPALALMLSTLVPGAGQVYCRRAGDGIVALLIVGVLTYGSYHYYMKDNVPLTLTFSLLDLFFYSGNIYGAYNSARRYNILSAENRLYEIKEKYWHEME